MKHYYDTDGHELKTPPDPYKGRSPMHKPDGSYDDDAFRAMGGRIVEDGQPTPEDRVRLDLASLLADLAKKVQGVTIDDFKAAARTLHSGELVAWAREHDVPEDVIAEARSRIVEILADAMREGMTWADLLK